VILQWKQYKDCVGATAKDCAADRGPVGTGPYKLQEFKGGEVVRYNVNDHYRDPAKPFFATVTIQGGLEPVEAARSVFETGTVDIAPSLQLDPVELEVLAERSDKAVLVRPEGRDIAGVSKSLRGVALSNWDSSVWNIADWYR
jgi:peptide/nickel transport system substrate-binding protein